MSDAQPTATPESTNGQDVKQQNGQTSISRTIKWITTNFALVVGMITAFGFFTVQSYLASLTPSSDIFSYNVSLTQYLSAGVSIGVGFIAYIADSIFPNSSEGLIITFLLFILAFWLLLYVRKQDKRQMGLQGALRYSLTSTIYFYAIIFPFFAFIYGNSFYAQIPRMFGGGEPTPVTLVFYEAYAPDSVLGLPIKDDNPRQSEPLELLMELTDGYLVRHVDGDATPPIETVVMVKGDIIQAVIYVQP